MRAITCGGFGRLASVAWRCAKVVAVRWPFVSIVPGDYVTSLGLFVVVRGSSALPSTSRSASQYVMVVHVRPLVGRVHALRSLVLGFLFFICAGLY